MLYFITISTLFFLCKGTYTCDSSVTDCSGVNADNTQICCLDTAASTITTSTVCQECTTNNFGIPDTCDTCCYADATCGTDGTRECEGGDYANQVIGLCRDVSSPTSICDSHVRQCDPLVTNACDTGLSCETRNIPGTTEDCSVCVCADCDYASSLTDDGCTDANQVCNEDTSGIRWDGLECGTCQDTTPTCANVARSCDASDTTSCSNYGDTACEEIDVNGATCGQCNCANCDVYGITKTCTYSTQTCVGTSNAGTNIICGECQTPTPYPSSSPVDTTTTCASPHCVLGASPDICATTTDPYRTCTAITGDTSGCGECQCPASTGANSCEADTDCATFGSDYVCQFPVSGASCGICTQVSVDPCANVERSCELSDTTSCSNYGDTACEAITGTTCAQCNCPSPMDCDVYGIIQSCTDSTQTCVSSSGSSPSSNFVCGTCQTACPDSRCVIGKDGCGLGYVCEPTTTGPPGGPPDICGVCNEVADTTCDSATGIDCATDDDCSNYGMVCGTETVALADGTTSDCPVCECEVCVIGAACSDVSSTAACVADPSGSTPSSSDCGVCEEIDPCDSTTGIDCETDDDCSNLGMICTVSEQVTIPDGGAYSTYYCPVCECEVCVIGAACSDVSSTAACVADPSGSTPSSSDCGVCEEIDPCDSATGIDCETDDDCSNLGMICTVSEQVTIPDGGAYSTYYCPVCECEVCVIGAACSDVSSTAVCVVDPSGGTPSSSDCGVCEEIDPCDSATGIDCATDDDCSNYGMVCGTETVALADGTTSDCPVCECEVCVIGAACSDVSSTAVCVADSSGGIASSNCGVCEDTETDPDCAASECVLGVEDSGCEDGYVCEDTTGTTTDLCGVCNEDVDTTCDSVTGIGCDTDDDCSSHGMVCTGFETVTLTDAADVASTYDCSICECDDCVLADDGDCEDDGVCNEVSSSVTGNLCGVCEADDETTTTTEAATSTSTEDSTDAGSTDADTIATDAASTDADTTEDSTTSTPNITPHGSKACRYDVGVAAWLGFVWYVMA
eukprot:652718_1